MSATAPAPLRWIPTLYMAQGLPFYTMTLVVGLMFKSLGLPNEQITRWTGVLGIAWAIKPLWSPLIELTRHKQRVAILFEALGGLCMAAAALVLGMPDYFYPVILVLAIASLVAATHDIAADGVYMASLDDARQSMYMGWCGAFFNAGKFVALGGLVILAGYLEQRIGVLPAWRTILLCIGLLLGALAAYHLWALPRPAKVPLLSQAGAPVRLRDVLTDFLAKPGIWTAIAFIVLFRVGEALVQSVGPLFLREARAAGGLGLSTAEVGAIYGTSGTAAFIVGSIGGGYFASWLSLRRAMPWLVLAMNLPNLAFFLLGAFQPHDLALITVALGAEMLGYGFGFVGLILYMMQGVALGRFQAAHYAFGSGIMQLGFVLVKMVSGDLQALLGYRIFFAVALVAAVPALWMSRSLPLLRPNLNPTSTPT
jgi:MFS transporter, PAT family, beta-lactamase induction signal transducer AmpG